jgi:hypothetical protein
VIYCVYLFLVLYSFSPIFICMECKTTVHTPTNTGILLTKWHSFTSVLRAISVRIILTTQIYIDKRNKISIVSYNIINWLMTREKARRTDVNECHFVRRMPCFYMTRKRQRVIRSDLLCLFISCTVFIFSHFHLHRELVHFVRWLLLPTNKLY